MASENQTSEQKSNTANNAHIWRLKLTYDVVMLVLIIINLCMLLIDYLSFSTFGLWFFQLIGVSEYNQAYQTQLHPIFEKIEIYFTLFLIIELSIRWLFAIITRQYQRWFFFPFANWYEFLAIVPQLRFLRLLRAGFIIYKLMQHGYQVIPASWLKRAKFYYDLILEELTGRIVLTVLGGIDRELKNDTSHRVLIHGLIDRHRQPFAQVLSRILQQSLSHSLVNYQATIGTNIDLIVQDSIKKTPEIQQLIKLMPFFGDRIEQLVESIGGQLGENIAVGLVQPFTEQPSALVETIAEEVSQVPLDNEAIDQFVESVLTDALNSLRNEIKIKKWQQILDE